MDKKSALNALHNFRSLLNPKESEFTSLSSTDLTPQGNAREGSDIDVLVISDDFPERLIGNALIFCPVAIYEVFEPIEAVRPNG